MAPRILVFPGSIRSGSFNASLADAAASILAGLGAEVTRISLADYPMPLVDEDLMSAEGVPENALKLARQIAAHDGVFLACPEYNASITPLMKNTIDWVSLVGTDGGRPLKAWAGKPVALGSASDGKFGGIRGLYHVRAVLMNVGCEVLSAQVGVSFASRAFDEVGMVKDDMGKPLLDAACRSLVEYSATFARR